MQRLKQQQQIILKQQQQANHTKQESIISDDEHNKDLQPPAKKAKKINGNEIKHKRQTIPKSSEHGIKRFASNIFIDVVTLQIFFQYNNQANSSTFVNKKFRRRANSAS